MTNRIFPLVLFVCLCPFFSAVAQGTELIRNLEKPELESLLTSYVKLKMLNSTFKQIKTIQELKTELTSEGTLSVLKPRNITWTVKKPSFLQVNIDDKSINITTIKDKQPLTQTLPLSNISSQQGAQGLSLLIPWLEMNVDKIMELYTIKSPTADFLQFYPKTSSPFKSIEMNLDKKKHIRKLKFFENNSDTIEIQFADVKIQAT